ncbi:hypothetical protein ACLQ18_02165 [Streptomyces sp. DT193]
MHESRRSNSLLPSLAEAIAEPPGTNSMVGMRTPVSTADLLSRICRM